MVRNAPVFDYLPPGILPITNETIDSAIHQARDDVFSPPLWETMLDEQLRQLRTSSDFRECLESVYRDAEVDLISPTVWSIDPRLSFGEGVYRDLTRWYARFNTLDWMRPITSPADIPDPGTDVGVVLNVQDLGGFTQGDIRKVDELFDAGVRILQLTYNRQNAIGSGCMEPSDGGLSRHGQAVVKRLNELGAIIDLSHCNLETTLDAIRQSETPVAVTHSHCGALHDHVRSKSDAEIEALAANDGYFGVAAYPHHYDEPTFDSFFEHFEHAVSVLGIDNVGVGTDWGMLTPDVPTSLHESVVTFLRNMTAMDDTSDSYDAISVDRFQQGLGSFETYDQRPVIRKEFETRGYSDREIDAVLGGNFVEFWRRTTDE